MRSRCVVSSSRALTGLIGLAAFAVVATGLPADAAPVAAASPSAAASTTPSSTTTTTASDDDTVRPDPVSAMATARLSGRRVEDESQRDEYSRVYANPDGTWSSDTASSPTSVRDGEGEWVDVDYSLLPVEGGLAPRYSPVDVTFSDGGDATFASVIDEHGKEMAWRWPATLPTPVVDGSQATYPGAAPGGATWW